MRLQILSDTIRRFMYAFAHDYIIIYTYIFANAQCDDVVAGRAVACILYLNCLLDL